MDTGIWQMGLWDLIRAGGPMMAPIILCSIFAFTIFIERMIYFNSIKTDVQMLKEKVFEFVKQNQIKEAYVLCEKNPSPVAKILLAGISKFGASREEIKEHIEDASLFIVPQLEAHLMVLATIAHISPLLGFMGTVTGIATSFHTIEVRVNALNPVTSGDLAGGIWEALITTVAGLMVAIPTLVGYNYCVHRVDRLVLEMEQSATELVNILCQITEKGQVNKE